MNNFNSNWDGVDRNTTNHFSEASQRVIGKYRFTPFTKDTNKDGVKGWTISIQNKGVVGYIAEPNSLSNITIKIYRTKGLSFKDFFPGELKMSAYPGKENRITNDVIHYAPRQLLKAVARRLGIPVFPSLHRLGWSRSPFCGLDGTRKLYNN